MKRRVLFIDSNRQTWHLETLRADALAADPREDYGPLSGETLCQYLLRRDTQSLVIACGPMPFLSGNKATVGYVSPLTGYPHYSVVGGRSAAQLVSRGLDAICFLSPDGGRSAAGNSLACITVEGYAPDLQVHFRPADELPLGQRSAYYWLVTRELEGQAALGAVFTIGQGARLGYASANLAVDAIYHAGRGGAGQVFGRYAAALVLRGDVLDPRRYFTLESGLPSDADRARAAFVRHPNASISALVERHCARLSAKTGGTVAKLYTTGADPEGRHTLPAMNARQVGYALADLGSPQVLRQTRQGQTGCQWCQVDCRHYHWVAADYAPDGRDMLLDDFEPTYAIYAMLGLEPRADSLQGRLDLVADVERRIILPLEELGCDILNVGLGLAALFEGLETGDIPSEDAPAWMRSARGLGNLDMVAQAAELLGTDEAAAYPALRAAADGPQALAERYPTMRDLVFTGGRRTLGNAGHSNALWTFLMPFSRFFGHYVGQLYKIEVELPSVGADEETYRACFREVVQRALEREFFWLLGNALSQCAFTFVIYSQDGQGERLAEDGLLVRLLRQYGIETSASELRWFSQAFWAQSIALKCEYGWEPPSADEMPRRIYESLAPVLERDPDELRRLMDLLIEEWKRQAGAVMRRFGYQVPWQGPLAGPG